MRCMENELQTSSGPICTRSSGFGTVTGCWSVSGGALSLSMCRFPKIGGGLRGVTGRATDFFPMQL